MPHQRKALKEMKNGCILKGGTGSGKTITALAYYADVEDKGEQRLVVITTAMKRDSGDWEAEAREFGLFPEVDSWNNMAKYEDVENAFFIFDEQRVVGTGVWVKSFLKITKKNQWILLSATPGDTWLDYIPVFLAHGFYRNRSHFLEEHVMFHRFTKYPKVERYFSTGRLAEHLSSILVEMPYKKHTVRHEVTMFCEYDRELYDLAWKRRWNFLEGRPIRHVSELFALIRRVVNTDPSRLQHVRDILVTHPKLIIFYNFDYELEILRTLDVKQGERNGHRHDPVPDGDEWVYLVQYKSGSEAWNCTKTDTTIFWSLTYSYRAFEQSKGRIDRLDTDFTDLYYYIMRSSSGIDNGIAATLFQKKNFSEMSWLKTAL